MTDLPSPRTNRSLGMPESPSKQGASYDKSHRNLDAVNDTRTARTKRTQLVNDSDPLIGVLNAGSSSLKFAFYEGDRRIL
jgi:hypothetical protein